MLGDLLLYLHLCDIWEISDSDLREFLESLLYQPFPDNELGDELRAKIVAQVDADGLDRALIASWPEEYLELLPPVMASYPEALEAFGELMEGLTEGQIENGRLDIFRDCLDLLAPEASWNDRSEGARALASLEEEAYNYLDQLRSISWKRHQATPLTVVGHRFTMEGMLAWQDAFRTTHQGDLDQAFEHAWRASRLLKAVQRWYRVAGEMMVVAGFIEQELEDSENEPG